MQTAPRSCPVPPDPRRVSSAGRSFRAVTHGIGVSPVPPDPNNPAADGKNHIAVAGGSGWVVTTHDGGATWHEVNLIATVPNWAGFNSSVEWADNSTLYIATENASFGGHLAKSTNGGLTFTDISGAPF